MYTCPLVYAAYQDLLLVGSKAAALGELLRAGLPVPPAFVVMTTAHDSLCAAEDERYKTELLAEFERLNAERVAVRSSAVVEDSSTASWAGQLDSYLNVTRDHLVATVAQCWHSFASERATSYAKRQMVPDTSLKMAVIVQAMIDSDTAGVVFTVDPVTHNHRHLIIEAAYGLGVLVVQGELIPARYVVDKSTTNIVSCAAGEQRTLLTYSMGRTLLADLPETQWPVLPLSDDQLTTLSDLAIQIERHFRAPQDIEWASCNGCFYILQSRPITTPGTPDQTGPQATIREAHYEASFERQAVTPFHR